jgi:hypothetical protein
LNEAEANEHKPASGAANSGYDIDMTDNSAYRAADSGYDMTDNSAYGAAGTQSGGSAQ